MMIIPNNIPCKSKGTQVPNWALLDWISSFPVSLPVQTLWHSWHDAFCPWPGHPGTRIGSLPADFRATFANWTCCFTRTNPQNMFKIESYVRHVCFHAISFFVDLVLNPVGIQPLSFHWRMNRNPHLDPVLKLSYYHPRFQWKVQKTVEQWNISKASDISEA